MKDLINVLKALLATRFVQSLVFPIQFFASIIAIGTAVICVGLLFFVIGIEAGDFIRWYLS